MRGGRGDAEEGDGLGGRWVRIGRERCVFVSVAGIGLTTLVGVETPSHHVQHTSHTPSSPPLQVLAAVRAGDSNVPEDCRLSGDVSAYRLLNQSGCSTLNGVDDHDDFKLNRAALQTIQVPDEEIACVWRVLAIILHLGNLAFAAKPDSMDEDASAVKSDSLAAVE